MGSLVVFPYDVVSAAVSGHVAIKSPLAAYIYIYMYIYTYKLYKYI